MAWGAVLLAVVAAVAAPAPAAGQSGAVPDRPARPVVDAVGHDFVTLSWDDPGDATITGYQILRRNRDVDAVGDFTIVEDDTANADTVYTDRSVEAAIRYVYRVKARNAHGLSLRSPYIRAETLSEPATDPQPDPEPEQATETEPETEPEEPSDPYGEARAAATNLRDITYFPRAQTVSGALDGAQGSVHYYRFTVGLSMVVDLRLHSQDADGDLVLEDADGVVVAEARSPGTANESIATRLEPGRYYIRVEAREPGVNAYELRYEGLSYTVPLNLRDLTNRIPYGLLTSYVAANVGGPSDRVDYYRFTLRAPRTLHLVMWRLEGDLDLFVEDGDGTVVRASRTTGTADESLDVTLAAGTWYFVVRPQQAGSNLSYVTSFWVSVPSGDALPETGPDDYADEASDGASLPVGATVRGQIDTPGDEDWFAVELVKGHTYQIDLDGPAQPYVHELLDSAGNVISEETDPGGGSQGPSQVRYKNIDGNTGITGVTKAPEGQTADWGQDDAAAVPVDDGDGLARSAPSSDPPGTGAMAFGDGWAQITPIETATYYLSTRSDKGTGGYEVSLRQVTDDYPATPATTATVTVGGMATGEIEQAGDADWFKVENLEAGKAYLVDLMGAQTGDGTLRDPYLAGIHNAGGARISGTSNDDRGAGTNSRVRFAPASDGTYFVAARGAGDRIGTYTLAVTQQPDDFDASTTGTTGTVTVGGTATGEIEAEGDLDWFEVTLEANKTYRFDAKGKQLFQSRNGTLLNPYIDSLHRSDGTRIAGTHVNDGGSYWDARIDHTATAAGTYYLSVGGYGEGTYTVAVTDITGGPPDDHSADTTTTATITVGDTATGEVQFHRDDDWFAVTLDANKTYYIDLMALHLTKGTLDWPTLHGIHDSTGTLVAGTANNETFDGPSTSDRQVFTPATTGVYYVAAGGPRLFVREGTYTVRVTDMTPGQTDDHLHTTASTATVDVDGSVTARSEVADDRDWYKVNLTANKVYRFDLMGAWTGDGTLNDPVLHGIRDSSGTLIAGTADRDSGTYTNDRTFFTPSTTADYFVDAGGTGVGTYTLAVTNITDSRPDDYDATTTGTTGTLAIDGSATGDIGHPGDRDWFAVTLEANAIYQFDLKGGPTGDGLPGFGTLNDPYLHGIHNSGGTRIAGTSDDDSGVHNYSRVRYRATTGGTHYISAGGDSGTYTLFAAALGSDDYAADTATTGTVDVGGSVTGDIEREGDRDWFKATLTAGTSYRIELKGARTRDGTLRDPHLSIPRGPSGPLANPPTDDGSGIGGNSLLTFTPATTGVHYISAGADRDWTGTYTLYLTQTAP